MQSLVMNYYEMAAVILFGIGLSTLLLQRNILKKVIGLNIMDTAIFLYLAVKGYIVGRVAPIIVGTTPAEYINPLPSGLVLTGIVVGVSVTAFSLVLCLKLYEKYHTLDIDKIALIVKGEE